MNTVFDFSTLPPVLPKTYLQESLDALKRNGLPKGLNTGLSSLDDLFRLDRGRLVTITGVPNLGKSEFVDFLTSSYNKNYGMKTLYFSPENMPVELHVEKLMRKFTCKPLEELSPEEFKKASAYIFNNFYFMNSVNSTRLSEIITVTEDLVKNVGIDILVIDPYNRVEVEKGGNDIETQYISKILDELSRLALRCNLIVLLVAHPRKMETSESKGQTGFRMPNAYDINGSANFFNKSDFVLIVHRKKREETDTTIKVDKVKFTNYGKPGVCTIGYDMVSGNYMDIDYSTDIDLNWNDDEDSSPMPFPLPEVKEAGDPLVVKITLYSSPMEESGTQVSLKDFLFTDQYKDIVGKIRGEETPEKRHDLKEKLKGKLPCATISGTFTNHNTEGLIQHSGYICIDIDGKDNPTVMDKVPSVLQNKPYVTYAAKSITGDGYYAVIRIENPKHHKEHFLALEKEFKEEHNIVLDPTCKDVCRLRFASYDENPYYNPSASTYFREFSGNDATQEATATVYTRPLTMPQFYISDTRDPLTKLDYAISLAQMRKMSVADDYDLWFELAMSLSTLGEDGRSRFHAISALSEKYDKDECDRLYSDVLNRYSDNNRYTLATANMILNNAINSTKNNGTVQ